MDKTDKTKGPVNPLDWFDDEAQERLLDNLDHLDDQAYFDHFDPSLN